MRANEQAGGRRPVGAFHCAERGKARTLAELLARERLDSRTIGLPAETAGEEELLLAEQSAALASLRDTRGDLRQARSSYEQVTGRLNEFITRVRQHQDPVVRRYAALRYPRPVRVEEIPLAVDEVLLEYSVLPDESLLWVVQKGRPVELIHIPVGAAELREEVPCRG